MLNKEGQRELAYVVIVDDVIPIDGYDRVELARVGGWTIVVGKGEFKAGDPAVYFEIDSKLPEVEPFINMEFLAAKHYKIKTQKMCKSISQGLLMSAANFGWNICGYGTGNKYIGDGIIENDGTMHITTDDSRFLTKRLGVTYYDPEDNRRKAPSYDKYKAMASRYPKLFQNFFIRKIYKTKIGKKILFAMLGKGISGGKSWPEWVRKTDEERVQNMPWVLNDKSHWIVTEKIDGTSTTFTMKRGKPHLFVKEENEYVVCSRNVAFNAPDKKCYYEENVYTKMDTKYGIKGVLEHLLNEVFPEAEWVTIQGETYGRKIQVRDYSRPSNDPQDFAAFNLITSDLGRLGSVAAAEILAGCGIPFVPILDTDYILPDTVEEMLAYAEGESVIDGLPREGVVLRYKDGTRSFKAVSNNYLLKYHG